MSKELNKQSLSDATQDRKIKIESINERVSKLFKPVSMGELQVNSSSVMTEEELCIRYFLEAINYDAEIVDLILADTKESNYYRGKITEIGLAQLILYARGNRLWNLGKKLKISKTHIIKFGKFTIKTKMIYGCLYSSVAIYQNISVQSGRIYVTKQESIDDIINEIGKTFHQTVKELI